MSDKKEEWKKVREERKQHYIFKTSFGYDGRELELALSMYQLGFINGFDDLETHINLQQKKLDIATSSLKKIKEDILSVGPTYDAINSVSIVDQALEKIEGVE